MSVYPISGALPQYAKYIGEFVPDYNHVHYFYRVIAYNRSRTPLTNTHDTPVSAYGPEVLDGDHGISINWTTVIGASFYVVYKAVNATPPSSEQPPHNIWYIASATETEIMDVGYPEATRNCFLNPGVSPIFEEGCCGDEDSEPTNVPPVGMAKPDDGHQGGGFVRMEAAGRKNIQVGSITARDIRAKNLAAMQAFVKYLKAKGISTEKIEAERIDTERINVEEGIFKDGHELGVPAGPHGSVQFNDRGFFGGDVELYWDEQHKRLGIHTTHPRYPLDVDGHDEHEDDSGLG